MPKRQSSWDSEGGSLVDKRSSRRTSPRRARLRRATAHSLPRELDHEGHRELKVLEAISENERTTQRTVAAQLGIALGLANLYIRRLVRKGYIKAVSIPSNRVLYLITPKGIAEKTRLTFKYMEYSLQVFRRARMHLKTMLEPYAGDATRRIAIYGTGEAAELAYLCLRELAIEPTAVLDDDGSGRFFNLPVQAIGSVDEAEFDLVVVATLDDPSACVQLLISRGIPARKLVTLRGPVPDAGGGQAARPVGSGNGQP